MSSIQKEEGDGSPGNMDDDEAHSPPAMELFQQVAELARKTVENVAKESEEQLQKENEVVQEENVQDEAVSQMEDEEIPQEAHMAASITKEEAQKVDDASLQRKDETAVETSMNVTEEEHQKVDVTPYFCI